MKKKVFHLVTALDFGGVEKHMEVIASSLDKSSFEHIFVAIGAGGATEEKLKALGARVYCLNLPTKIPSISSISALFSFFREHKPWVVHAHGAEANFHGLIAAWLARVPVRIGEEIGMPSHGKVAKLVFKFVHFSADRVIGVADSVVKWLVDNGEVEAEKAVRIYNPVILPRLRIDSERPSGPFKLSFVGRLEPVKNPEGLVRAIYALKNDGVDVELLVVGTGSQHDHLLKLVSDLGIQDSVHFFGFQTDPHSYIRASDLFIQPSLSEGLSLALVEAMGCGVPAIATPVGGSPEVISHNNTGWLLEDSSVESIVSSIKHAISLGRDNLFSMGQEARHAVEGRFDPIKYVQSIENLYTEVVSGDADL